MVMLGEKSMRLRQIVIHPEILNNIWLFRGTLPLCNKLFSTFCPLSPINYTINFKTTVLSFIFNFWFLKNESTSISQTGDELMLYKHVRIMYRYILGNYDSLGVGFISIEQNYC